MVAIALEIKIIMQYSMLRRIVVETRENPIACGLASLSFAPSPSLALSPLTASAAALVLRPVSERLPRLHQRSLGFFRLLPIITTRDSTTIQECRCSPNSALLKMVRVRPTYDDDSLNRSYFNDENLSDLAIKLSDGTTVRVHRIVLCRRSRYFEKLITAGFKV